MRFLAYVLCCMLLLPAFAVQALMEEDTTFRPSHAGTDYPVGQEDFQINFGFQTRAYRMLYPAMTDGDGAQMAGNGPFPWVLFWGDYNELSSGYDDFSSALVQRGFIVIVAPEPADIDELEDTILEAEAIASIMDEQNQTGELVDGSIGNVDTQHWGVGGHGKGALLAYAMFPYWEHSQVNSSIQPPRALFGLALDSTDWPESVGWFEFMDNSMATIPIPSSGLFITGTVDSISPSATNRDFVQTNGQIAWHWMHLLGADHYQFQDTTSIFENDNTPGISQEEQIEESAYHIVAYLDATLRADVERYQVAFNREDSRDEPSDASSYISEDMLLAQFVKVGPTTTSPVDVSQLEGWDNLTMMANISLRDGRTLSEVPQYWDIEVECGWMSSNQKENGTVLANSSVSCTLPMMNVSPGQHTSYLRVFVNKTPGVAFFDVERTNTPLELNQPLAEFRVPQRGETTLDVANIATDPDGQIIRALQASVDGADASHFTIQVGEGGLSVTVSHSIDEEWIGEADANITLRADGVYQDQRDVFVRIVVLPVDDPVVVRSTIPQQVLEEDGPTISVNLTEIVSDPEGEEILALIQGKPTGSTNFVSYDIVDGVLYLTPLANINGAEIISLLLGDGTNPGVTVDLPIRINPVDDIPIINQSAWVDISLAEDEQLVVELSSLAYDIDGDLLAWSFEIESTTLSGVLENNRLVLTPKEHANGDAGKLTLRVSDGTTVFEENLSLQISSVPDAPIISIQSSTLLDTSSATIQWLVMDVDGLPRQEVEIIINGETLQNVSHSCLTSNMNTISCVSMVPLPFNEEEIYGIEVKYFDEELQSYYTASLVFDGGTVEDNTNLPTNAEETSTGLPVEVVGLVVGACIVLAGVFRLFMGRESTIEVVEEQTKETPSGLLARAQKKQ